MKKFVKIIAAVMLFICLACGFAACGDNGNGNDNGGGSGVDYTVTVTCDDAVTLRAVTVRLVKADGSAATTAKYLTDGKATFNLTAGTYKVFLGGAIRDYEYDQTTLTATTHAATVALRLKESGSETQNVDYVITVQYPDGTPVPERTEVNLCAVVGGQCHPAWTDAQGKITLSLPAAEYEVHVNNCPNGYEFDNSYYRVDAQTRELTVKLKAAA